jgi:cobalt-zinc-cadmium efflux system outer membrane protein
MKTHTLLLLLLTTLSAEAAGRNGELDLPSPPLSLSGIVRAVSERNPSIEEALRKWDAARQRVIQEGAWDDLQLSGTTRVRRYVDIPPNAFTDQMLAVEQVIPISGKNRVRAQIATADAITVFEQVRRQQLEVVTKARSAYFRLANASAQIELNRKNYQSLTQIAEIGRSRYEAGTQTAADVLLSETEAAKLLEARRDLERNVATEQSQLNVLMNRDAFAPLAVSDDVSLGHREFSIASLRVSTLSNRPEIRAARARIAAGQASLRLAHRAWVPDPSLKIEGQRYNDAAQSLSELDAGISFSVPWGNPRKYSASVTEARANLAAAQAALQRTETEAIGSLREALQNVSTTLHHLELFRDKLVPKARQTFQASQLAYESGQASFAEWIMVQRTLRDIEAEARMHLTNYQIALAELESVVGADLNIFPPSNRPPNSK